MKSILLSLLLLLGAQSAFSDSRRVLLKDIGIIGLASHDMFSWDRKNERNVENGRFDLSTIFDYDNGSRWEKGGDKKNGENSPVWSITKRLVLHYKGKLQEYKGIANASELARIETVQMFHAMIKDSFERLSGLPFPENAINAKVNNVEQSTLRALHDILPGRVKVLRGERYPLKSFRMTNPLFMKFYLNDQELNQKIKYFDGDYAEEYKNIKLPFSRKVINLKEIDGKFIEKFSPYRQDAMLAELKEVGEGSISISEVSFIHHIRELFQKGMCSTGNKWVATSIPCL